MVTDALGLLLEDIGKFLGITLTPDSNNSCFIKFPDGFSIQIEMDKTNNYLMLGCDLGEIPPGPFRENVFREALKYNGKTPPLAAEFGFSTKTRKIAMFRYLPAKNLQKETIIAAIVPFLELGKTWHESLLRGDVPTSLEGSYPTGGSKMFGMK